MLSGPSVLTTPIRRTLDLQSPQPYFTLRNYEPPPPSPPPPPPPPPSPLTIELPSYMASPSSSPTQSQPPMASPLPSSPPSPSPSSLPPKDEQSLVTVPRSKHSSPPKKSPPTPWSHKETLAIIHAYQEKWYSLNKGQLKAFQWDEVAAAVAASCGFDEPSKTSIQCRHKIEKLRKRYRSELQKPYPDSWQYFSLMDQMERGPMPLIARPVTVVKPSSSSANKNVAISNNSNNLHPSRYRNSSRGDWGESDESDEEWNAGGYGVGLTKRNRSKSINNLVRGDVMNGVRSAKRVAIERGFNGGSGRVMRASSNQMNGKSKQYYVGEDSEEDDGDDDPKNEEDVRVEEEGNDPVDGRALAAEIKGFAEGFIRSENKKIEMMRETERYRMEMEKKRMEMILVAQRKIIDTIGSAFGN